MHRDLVLAARALRRRPSLSLAVVTTLACGVAVITTMFALLDGFVWRPLPYPGIERLVGIEEVRERISESPRMEFATYEIIRANARSFSHVAAAQERDVTVDVDGSTFRGGLTRATPDAFPLLGVPPLLGRYPVGTLQSGDAGAEVAIGEQIWERRFGRDSTILGRQLRVDGVPATVVGVMPRRFEFHRASQLWMALEPFVLRREPEQEVMVVAQLRDGVSRDQAAAEMATLGESLAGELQRDSHFYLLLVHPEIVRRDAVPPPLANLMIGTAAAVFLVACINTASLLLARALSRRGEIAIRAALGAGRGALFRHGIAETLVLAAAGGAVGVLLSVVARRALLLVMPSTLPMWVEMRLDWRVLGVALGATVVAALVVSLPALRIGRRTSLQQVVARAGTTAGSSARLPTAAERLVIGQVAFAFLLVFAATLMYRSYRGLLTIESGLDTKRVLVADVALRGDPLTAMRQGAPYTAAALDRLEALPGVDAVASRAAFSAWRDDLAALDAARGGGVAALPGQPWDSLYTEDGRVAPRIAVQLKTPSVSDDYFRTVGLRLRSGRLFGPEDAPGTPHVVVMSRALATQLWPSGSAVGQRIRYGAAGQWITVVGTVDDVQWTYQGWNGTGAGPELLLYFSARQTASWKELRFLVRTPGPLAALTAPVRSTLRSVDQAQVVTSLHGLTDDYTRTARDRRWMTVILTTCGVLTLALAALGLYGLLALLVAMRLREVGIRLALGAPARAVAWGITAPSLRLVGTGAGVGVLLCLLSHRVLKIFLFRTSMVDPLAYLAVAAVFLTVAVAASAWPVRRALQADPVAVLRE